MVDTHPALALRAELYHALAEVLVPPMLWMTQPGMMWPLYEAARALRPFSHSARQAAETLASIGTETEQERLARYEAAFMGNGRPRLWLYESMMVNGRLLGPETQKLALLYQTAGLQMVSSELPDHASMELTFLGYVAEMQVNDPENRWRWQKLERSFIKKHAGRWLPEVGRALARSGDDVYAPIGSLLANWLEEALQPPRQPKTAVFLPTIPTPADCTLCGFCVQICPTKALAVYETEQETALLLATAACIGCRKCEHICDTQAIKMAATTEISPPAAALRRSPRAVCAGCKRPLVSQAELDYVARQLGHPAWLNYCLDCRPQIMMESAA
ncbi:MAG: molecular chaperone TorD family protein [Ardenticatenaceae bacterium]|nr:molecular chaperone TorD family protein [Ardenticatenaceae bacterium]